MAPTPFFLTPLGTLPGVLFAAWLAFVYASFAAIKLALDLLIYRGAFFAAKDRTGKNRPAILDAYGTHQFILLPKQKIKLHYVSAGSEDRPLMLFVHGFPECWFSWRHQMEAFKGRYHTVAINMRGYGESDKPEGVSNYASDLLVADLIELIECLVNQKNPKCVLVGHDWGGILAWTVAQLRPDLVDRFIVLNAPHPVSWLRRIGTSVRQFASSWYMFFFNAPFLPEIYFRKSDYAAFDRLFGPYQSADETAVYKHYYAQEYGITGPLNFYRASLRGYGSGKSRRAARDLAKQKIQPKTIVIWGTEDEFLTSVLATDSAKLCRDAEVRYVEKCSHWIMLQRPSEVNAIMKQFLES